MRRSGGHPLRLTSTFAANVMLAALLLAVSGCSSEQRIFRGPAPGETPTQGITVSGLHPGDPTPGTTNPNTPDMSFYDENAYAVAQGRTLFNAYNCSGCHANGGGGMGVDLMDDQWIYGSQPQNIHATIVEGRPNGMPSFRGKIPDAQIWEIAAYVRSLSGLNSKGGEPGRSDDMYYAPAPANRPRLQPKGSMGPEPGDPNYAVQK
jgi:cytochrome c oxidase cbb3-type subunit III